MIATYKLLKFLPFFLLLSIIADLLSTYYCSPDLKFEGGWEVVYFDLKWQGIIIISAFYFLFTSTLYYYSFFKFKVFKWKSFDLLIFLKRFSLILLLKQLFDYTLAAMSNTFFGIYKHENPDNILFSVSKKFYILNEKIYAITDMILLDLFSIITTMFLVIIVFHKI